MNNENKNVLDFLDDTTSVNNTNISNHPQNNNKFDFKKNKRVIIILGIILGIILIGNLIFELM